LRSLQEIQLDFEEEAKAYAGLWSQGNKNNNNSDIQRELLQVYFYDPFLITISITQLEKL
jgi:hypothetical protein